MRPVLIGMLVFSLAAPASLLAQATRTAGNSMGAFVRGLKPGTYVSLRLADGSKVKGMLVGSDDDFATIKPKTRIPEPVRQVRLADIADADLARQHSVGRTIAIAAGVGAGAALGVLMLLVAAYGGD